jgi:hypothetical protein
MHLRYDRWSLFLFDLIIRGASYSHKETLTMMKTTKRMNGERK